MMGFGLILYDWNHARIHQTLQIRQHILFSRKCEVFVEPDNLWTFVRVWALNTNQTKYFRVHIIPTQWSKKCMPLIYLKIHLNKTKTHILQTNPYKCMKEVSFEIETTAMNMDWFEQVFSEKMVFFKAIPKHKTRGLQISNYGSRPKLGSHWLLVWVASLSMTLKIKKIKKKPTLLLSTNHNKTILQSKSN